MVSNMSFSDYSQKYLAVNVKQNSEIIDNGGSLYALKEFIRNNQNYKIYQTKDDYFVNQQQLDWLKQQSKNKTIR